MKQITLEDAIYIAKEDYNYGIMSAMDKLNSLGFKTPIYNAFINQIEEEELDYDDYEMNIACRDLQFQALNIYDTMQIAYDIVWCNEDLKTQLERFTKAREKQMKEFMHLTPKKSEKFDWSYYNHLGDMIEHIEYLISQGVEL